MKNFSPNSNFTSKFVNPETGVTTSGMATFMQIVSGAGGPAKFVDAIKREAFEEGRDFERTEMLAAMKTMIDQAVAPAVAKAMIAYSDECER